MAKVVGDIAIQVGADIGPLVRDLGRGSAAVSGFGGNVDRLTGGFKGAAVAGTAVAGAVVAAGTAIAALTKRSLDNIDALSKQARAAGVSVTSFQAMAQVAEEAGVESDKLSSVLTKMQKNIAELGQGTKTQVDAFGRLGVSLSELSGKNADEQFRVIAEALAGIGDPTTKTAAALDVFGKSGADVINMLDGYGAAVENAAKFQREFGIAVSDVDAQQIEAANDAMGRLGMAMDGLGNALAVKFAPAIATAAEGLTSFIAGIGDTAGELDRMFRSAEQAKSLLGEDVYNALIDNVGALDEGSESVARLRGEYEGLADMAVYTASELERAVDTVGMWGLDEVSTGLFEVAVKLRQLSSDLHAGKISSDDFAAGMTEATSTAEALFATLDASDQIIFSSAVAAVGGLTSALGNALSVAERLRAALPGASGPVDPGQSDDKAQSLADRRAALFSPLAPLTSIRPQMAPPLLGEPGGASSGGGGASSGGGGGGGSNPYEIELENLRDALLSKEQIEIESYERQQEALQAALDQKLITQEEYAAMMEEAQRQHAETMTSIDAFRYGDSLDQAGAFFGNMATALANGNEKMVKISRKFAALEAFISTMKGAAKEIEKGTFGFASAAAVIAKGMAFVSAIKSGGGSGGGGASSSGGAHTSAVQQAVPPQPLDVRLSGLDPSSLYSGAAIGSLLESLSKEAGDRGFRLMVAQ